ncbi:MAG: hypothetical protein NC080_03075 [Paraprevotella sp.]|nr:hypothetical protein [Paraprevotella sp.]
MKKLVIIIIANLSLLVQAQISNYPFPISTATSNVTAKDSKGLFVAQKVKGKISGSGLYQRKNGSLYIGDFKDKLFNGFGMLIASTDDSISNCPNARIYVGRFKNGIKHGKGSCYSSTGEVIYIGSFVDDTPVEEYDVNSISAVTFFADINTKDFYYIGEFSADVPHGFGAMFFQNGNFLISRFKNGMRDGICVYIESDGNWMTESISGGQHTFVSSSREYASYVAQSKNELKAAWKNTFGSNENWTTVIANLSEQIQNISQGADKAMAHNHSSERKHDDNTSTTKNKHIISEQTAYNVDKSTYSKYDSMLSQVFTGNRDASASEIISWQNKMRQLRQKWEQRGKSFPKSVNETR